ncbi:lipoyl synthase [Neochlamydia sp. EPS4]|uniref:lipoyl synthase n=1 Tax=Neochlamydia sp. EPS4 TaxID=1478175 RepID=UPI0009B59D36|nr:lipoyl synthase [Neochlamydia sp. EPS4]
MNSLELFDNTPRIKKKKLNILPVNPDVAHQDKAVGLGRFPSWLHRKLPPGSNVWKTGNIFNQNRLHTVCEEAKCPNLMECWSKKTATFLVMGKECTRACGFCDIDFSKAPQALEADEPQRVAESVLALGLKHVVITMVARDDLLDGGAEHLSKVIEEIRRQAGEVTIEVLTSDFAGEHASLDVILKACPEIFNHNLETVRALTPRVRHRATYDNTLKVLSYVRKQGPQGLLLKSGIMVGLGESEAEVFETLKDLKTVGCDIITLGQYLQPQKNKLLVKEFITPQQFKKYEEYGYSLGIKNMYCGPFIRSSYNAEAVWKQTCKGEKQ